MSFQSPGQDDDNDDGFYVVPNRLIPLRLARVWHMTEYIASNPGDTRQQLAQRYHLSERQLQADLNLVKYGMGLPLERDRGYRMVETPGACGLSQADALQLVDVLVRNVEPRVCEAVVALLPPHLRPLADLAARWGNTAVFRAIAEGLCLDKYVRIEFTFGVYPANVPHNPVVRPVAIIPYQGHSYLLGECTQRHNRRLVAIPLEHVRSAVIDRQPHSLAS